MTILYTGELASNAGSLPSWIFLSNSVFVINTNNVSHIEVELTACDNRNATATAIFSVNITNSPPTAYAIGPLSTINNIYFSTVFEKADMFSDDDIDNGHPQILNYYIDNLPLFLTVSNENSTSFEVQGTPSDMDVGVHNITFRATDTFENTTNIFTLTVVQNYPPTANNVSNHLVHEGIDTVIDLDTFNFVDPEGESITLTVEPLVGTLLPIWIQYDSLANDLIISRPLLVQASLRKF